MSHLPVTPDPISEMPKQQGILRRGSRYYANFKVPKDLRKVMGKEHIRETLGTSDHRDASREIAYRRAFWMAKFEEARRQLPTRKAPSPDTVPLLKVSSQEAFTMACRHLIQKEQKFRDWFEVEGKHLEGHEKQRTVRSLLDGLTALLGGDPKESDGTGTLESFLAQHDIACPVDSAAFQALKPLFLKAELEHTNRKLREFGFDPRIPHDVRFRDVFAHSPLPALKEAETTLSQLSARYEAHQKEVGRAPSTVMGYALPCRLLKEYFGDHAPLSSVTGEEFEKFCRELKRYPLNGAQRYPGKKIKDAIHAAELANDPKRLNARTVANNFERLRAFFAFAVEKKLVAENPAKDRYLLEAFGQRPEKEAKEQFTVPDELNRLFRAPIYTGCADGEYGCFKKGKHRPRGGRFWVPLLALFHGLRLNEACQLHSTDVQEKDGIPFLSIRATATDAPQEVRKRLKNKQSRREVPIHPKLIQIGFLDYVQKRKEDSESARLFPELPIGSKDGFSELFSKWFGRFVKKTLGDGCKATFHSFRHMFRDAARAARLPVEIVESLAGWESGKSAAQGMAAHYGGGAAFFKVLAEEIGKIDYPGLDLSHLVPKKPALPSKAGLRRSTKPIRNREE